PRPCRRYRSSWRSSPCRSWPSSRSGRPCSSGRSATDDRRTGKPFDTGEVELVGDDIRGLTVHLASRLLALAGPGEIVASATTRDLVDGSGLAFEERGRHELRGITG